jgi:8-oxo-dGTP diphosphatase
MSEGAGAFVGAKITILTQGSVLTLLRDDVPTISYPDMWDLPGGGREGDETPLACVLRETREEFGIALAPDMVRYRRFYRYPGQTGGWHFGAIWDDLTEGMIRFGEEGQMWRFMPVQEFVRHKNAVPFLKDRTRHFLETLSI